MYIYPVSLVSQVCGTKISKVDQNSQRMNKASEMADSFQKTISFGNFQTMVTEIADKKIKNLNGLEHSFNSLMKEIISDAKIEKTPYFSYLEAGFKESGFSGLLRNLRMPKSTPKINTLVEKSSENELVLAKLDGEPVLSLFNFGRYGFWESESSTRDMRLIFSNAEKILDKEARVEFTMNKKGQYSVFQRTGQNFIDTVYYPTTGNIRRETYCYAGGKPDTTYYNEDGSKAFFENWFYGGTPTEPIY